MKKSGRKSIWNSTETEISEPGGQTTWEGHSPLSGEQQPPEAIPVVEQLRVAEKKERNRQWERQPENRPMLIRGIPPVLRASVKEIAAVLNVRIDDVARAFLEFGLKCYRSGEIQIQPVLSDGRRTLFPSPDAGWGRNILPGWYEKVWDQQPPQKGVRSKRQSNSTRDKPWKWQASYRGIPEEIQAEIRQIRISKEVPLGEIATMLLGHALEAYKTGRLVLNPLPKTEAKLHTDLR
jgi:hypothetical protein